MRQYRLVQWVRAGTLLRWADVSFLFGIGVGAVWAWRGSPDIVAMITLIALAFAIKLALLPFWRWYDERNYYRDYYQKLRRL